MTAVRFDNVSKRYTRGAGYRSLRDTLMTAVMRPFSGRSTSGEAADFWALRDVSFEVQPAEALAVIGPNGAGKTTILKLLSRITVPTQGTVQARGKVASLIELGAGFHPELTGRENIFLNGSILGLSRPEIRRKLDSIVEFAGIGPFLDTPVKQFSSGMYVRLGFAIATHVDAEILLVDEVLAVGDIPFQRRCLQRLSQFRKEGRTIVFVSHNLHAVRGVATRALYLAGGIVRALGEVESVVGRYVDDASSGPRRDAGCDLGWRAVQGRTQPCIVAVELLDGTGRETRALRVGEPLRVRIHYESAVPVQRPTFGLSVWSDEGMRIATVDTRFDARGPETIMGAGWIECRFPSLPLLPRTYLLKGGVYDGETGWPYDRWGWEDGRGLSFQIETSRDYTPHVMLTSEHGHVYLAASWCWDEGADSATVA